MSKQSVIIDGVRSPIGMKNGAIVGTRPDDIAAQVVSGLMKRNPSVPISDIEDLVMGCAFPEGPQGMLIGRSVGILAGLPIETGGKVVNRFCGSSMDALHQVSASIEAGDMDVAVAAGVRVVVVVVLDADKAGFLRSKSSLMQIAGRASRNLSGFVILYADNQTDAIQYLIEETKRRREIQIEFNKNNNISPKTIYKSTDDVLHTTAVADSLHNYESKLDFSKSKTGIDFDKMDKQMAIDMMREEMLLSADKMEFEYAAKLRDEIATLENEVGKVFSK